MSELAVILVRSRYDLRHDVVKTLDTLGLGRKHSCAIVTDSPEVRGKLHKIRNVVTYGSLNADTKKLLEEEHGSHSKNDSLFFLAPPKGGFERKGIKVSFQNGGVLGDRGNRINNLIQKMV